MPTGVLWTSKRLQRTRDEARHFPPSSLGRRCCVCGLAMVTALAEAEPFACHPSCDPSFPALLRQWSLNRVARQTDSSNMTETAL